MKIYEERLNRIKAAIALEPVDKVPVISGLAAGAAPMTHTKVSDYLKDMELNCTCNLKATEMLGNVDGVQATLATPEGLPSLWLSNIGVPGEDIEDDQLWQVIEKELMTQEDYDIILRDGYGPWLETFMKEKLRDPMKRMRPMVEYTPTANQRFRDAGYVIVKDAYLTTPFEMLCGGRSMEAFLVDDLMEIPEKLDEVFAVVHKYNMEQYIANFESPNKPFGAWVGGWRGTPETLNPAMFQRFSWKYYRELVDLCIQYDVVPILHLDACWDRGLANFRDIPAKKAVMALDGKTDIHLAKEVVGDIMCVMGDVPASMLAFSKPQEVYDYTMNLIKTVGPTGYMVCSGCDIPFNGRVENMQMMAKAADDAAKR